MKKTLPEGVRAVWENGCYDNVYLAGNVVISIQETNSNDVGFDYTLYGAETGSEIDGGIIEDDEQDLDAALRFLAEDYALGEADSLIEVTEEEMEEQFGED